MRNLVGVGDGRLVGRATILTVTPDRSSRPPAASGRTKSNALRTTAVVFAALVVILAGCSDDADSGAGSTERSTTTVAESSTTTFAGTPSAGCTGEERSTEAPGLTRSEAVDSAGRERSYLLALPDDVDPDVPVPLVLALHGAGGSAEQFDESTDLIERSTDRGFVTLMPDAVEGSWDYGIEGPDDTFLSGLVDSTAEAHCIDLNRVHLVGMSLGAWKSAITACANPGTFASAVLVTVEVRPEGCEPLPVLAFHGTSDVMAPYGEGGDDVEIISPLAGLSGTRINMAAWAEGAGCDPTWDESRIEPDVVHWVYRACDDGLGVELYTIEGGNHAWPGSDADRALTTEAIDATDLSLDWFERHSR